jgi:hypothetical protein
MKRFIIIGLLLTSCTPTKPVPPVVAPVGPATQAVVPATADVIETKDSILSKVSASAGVIRVFTSLQPTPVMQGVTNEATLIQTLAGVPRAVDDAEALKRKLVIQAGDLNQISAAYDTAQTAAQAANGRADKAEADLKAAQAAATVEQGKLQAKFQKAFDDQQAAADARVAKVQDDARKAWMNKVNYVLLGLGALLILAAVANAWLTDGAQLAKSGILAVGAGLCFGMDYTLNQEWFKYVAIGATVITVLGAALWAYLQWKEHKAVKAAAVVATTAQKVVTALDAHYEAATPAVKAVLDPVFNSLGNAMDAAEKDAVKLLRYQGTVSQPSQPVSPAPAG